MLRSILIYLSKAAWAKRTVMRWSFAWRAASRFVAGEKLDDAIEVIKKLNEYGINATLDHLGEHTCNLQDASNATQEILKIIETIDRTGVRSNVSIKLTQIGLALDENIALENLKKILEYTSKYNNYLRIDMEDAPCVDVTLKLFKEMKLTFGYNCVGLVIQSYLYRSMVDINNLMDIGARIRLCKGAYKEPPEIAYPKKSDVDNNYDKIASVLIDTVKTYGYPILSRDGKTPPLPALATHDEKRIDFAKQYQNQAGISKESIEFQMLHGIRRDLQKKLVEQGFPVRVYVPYGTEWYPYFTRRLAERPANLWFFISNYFRQ